MELTWQALPSLTCWCVRQSTQHFVLSGACGLQVTLDSRKALCPKHTFLSNVLNIFLRCLASFANRLPRRRFSSFQSSEQQGIIVFKRGSQDRRIC